MIAGSQQTNESAKASAVIPIKTVASRKKGCRMLRQITVKCLPAIQFEVPIFFEFDPQSDPIPGLVPAETGELLTV